MRLKEIFSRYIILLIFGLGNLFLFYFILTPLTIYPVFFILSLFYEVNLVGINLLIGNYIIELVTACIAGAAYYLLLILNLATPMDKKTRIHSILFMFAFLLIVNIIRIVVLSTLFLNSASYFDFTHNFLWYGLSTIFVVVIWFVNVYIFKIKKIPFYSDFNYLFKQTKL